MIKHTKNEKTNSIKVGFLFNKDFFLGGGEISFFELVKSIDSKNYSSVVIVPGPGEIKMESESNNIETQITPLVSLRQFYKGSFIPSIIKLFLLLRKNKIDILHANGTRACFYAAIAGFFCRIPVIWHVRETINDIRFYEQILFYFSIKVVCVSKNVEKKRFGNIPNRNKNKIKIIYNGVNTNKFKKRISARKEIRSKLKIGNQVVFGIVGNIIPLKGHDFFVKSLIEAKKAYPDLNSKILFVGRPLNLGFVEYIKKLIIDNKLQDDIIFNGYSNQIIEYLSALDVFVLPSQREGFSRSLLEAMSVGLPVIATRIGEIQEAVLENENALLVDYDNTEELSSAIIQLALDVYLRDRLGSANRSRAIKYFDQTIHTSSVQNIYYNLSNRTK